MAVAEHYVEVIAHELGLDIDDVREVRLTYNLLSVIPLLIRAPLKDTIMASNHCKWHRGTAQLQVTTSIYIPNAAPLQTGLEKII
jgi:hypothetical protein